MYHYEKLKADFHKNGFEWINKNIIKRVFDACPDQFEPLMMAADINQRYNRWKEAGEYFQKVLQLSPNNEQALQGLSNCLRNSASLASNAGESTRMLMEAREVARHIFQVSHRERDKLMDWIYHDNAQIPFEGE